MAEPDIRWRCRHLQPVRGEGDLDFGYDIGGKERFTYRCWWFPGEGVINPAKRCGPACGAFALRERPQSVPVQQSKTEADYKSVTPSSLPAEVLRGIINAQKLRVDEELEKRIHEAERVERELQSAKTQIARINVELENINAAERNVVRARDEATTEWFDQLKGKHSSLQDLRAVMDSKRPIGTRARDAELRLADLAARREALRARRLEWERIKNRLLPELDLSLQRRRLLERLRDELNRLVDDRLSREAAPGRVASPQDFDALLTTVRTCLQDGVPLATLQETVENLEGSTDLPI